MTPTRRRPANPASQGPTRTAPDVPIVADPKPASRAKTTDSTELLGPQGEPIADEAPKEDVGQDPASPTATRAQRRPLSLYPLPVWPD